MKPSREGTDFACVISAAGIKLYCSTQMWGSFVKVKKVQSTATNVVYVLHKNYLLCNTSEVALVWNGRSKTER